MAWDCDNCKGEHEDETRECPFNCEDKVSDAPREMLGQLELFRLYQLMELMELQADLASLQSISIWPWVRWRQKGRKEAYDYAANQLRAAVERQLLNSLEAKED